MIRTFFLLITMSGCAAREPLIVRLDPQAIEFAKEHDVMLCGDDGTQFSPDYLSPIRERRPPDPVRKLYSTEQSEPTPAFLISGAVLTGVGGLGLAAAGVASIPCMGPAGCDLDDWVGPVAGTGLGLLIVGTTLLIVHHVQSGKSSSAALRDVGDGQVCKNTGEEPRR